MNHMEGTKHEKAIWERKNNDKATFALCSGKHG